MTLNKKSGFTLVELAIVMTIIGLLIGGILKGQELLENARVTSTIAQVKSYDAAVTGFRDIYDALPGDMANGQNRIPGCNAACNAAPTASTGGANDGRIGLTAWSSDWADQADTITPAAAQTAVEAETTLFWMTLLKANLITGVNGEALDNTTAAAWNVTHPAAKIGGGWLAGYAAGNSPRGQTTSTTSGPYGMVIGLAAAPTSGLTQVTSGQNVLTPSRAAQIDRKIDDGAPDSGTVQAYGTTGTAGSATTAATGCFVPADGTYSEANAAKDCGLVIRIQG